MKPEELKGTMVWPTTAGLREYMARYNRTGDQEDRVTVMVYLLGGGRKLLVPVMAVHDTLASAALDYHLYKGKRVLHAYTGPDMVPSEPSARILMEGTLEDLLPNGERHSLELLLIDPEHPHAVGLLMGRAPALIATSELRAYMGGRLP